MVVIDCQISGRLNIREEEKNALYCNCSMQGLIRDEAAWRDKDYDSSGRLCILMIRNME